MKFADVILPLSVKDRYTYSIPEKLRGKVIAGTFVRVQFGKRNTYMGVVASVHNIAPESGNVRDIKEISEELGFVNAIQLRLWNWISDYYMCNEGDVMKAALPSENAISNYKPKTEIYLKLTETLSEKRLNEILDSLKKAPRQYDLLSELIRLSGYEDGSEVTPVKKSLLMSGTHATQSAINALEKKGVIGHVDMTVLRTGEEKIASIPVNELSVPQQNSFNAIKKVFETKDIVLLHGVTSSGKTEIYFHLIAEQLKLGKQVLYMLPEIALTAQMISRLNKHFGSVTCVYHSRLNDSEKVEIWKMVSGHEPGGNCSLVLGVRSSVFLPFYNLGLVIVDEEHDPSYKQQDPAPRYNGRDSAIMLSHLHGARTILGSASPSIESYNNAITGKYGLVELTERYGFIKLPEIIISNTREAYRKKLMVSHFTPELLYAIDDALGRGEQIILFQNRRGFAPYIECSECGWIPTCVQCAVNLTYHKALNKLVCHYCGYTTSLPHSCGNCNSSGLVTKGFGTEKIEDEIKIVFPSARVARMDQDTTRTKNSFDRIIKSFEDRRVDILIGTQMISKGLDFENLTIVGILNADNMLNFPDFRAHERGFQLMEQVSGRAGRRQKQGKVIIQTADSSHRIIRNVIRHDYMSMFKNQLEERKTFNYPPFCRMIKFSIKHKDRSHLNHFSDMLGSELRKIFGSRILGPEAPVINRIQFWYIKTIILKIEREKPQSKAKQLIIDVLSRIENEKGSSGLRISIDVDPY
ncbi:MAG TPA: primosomal protein N' [Bacteroidales bacterium]|nr:primosomal protein N' [Bacteroidales bacterium]